MLGGGWEKGKEERVRDKKPFPPPKLIKCST